MKCDRKRLLEELRAVMPGVDQKAPLLEGADAFQFYGGRLYSYNDAVSVSVETHLTEIMAGDGEEEVQGLECAIRAKELLALLTKLKQEELNAAVTDGRLRLSAKGIKAELPILEATLSEKIDLLGIRSKWKPLPQEFQEALRTCAIEDNDSHLNGVYVTGSEMFSADHSRINRFTLGKDLGTFWIADKSAAYLARLPHVTHYQANDAWVHFKAKPPKDDEEQIEVVFSAKRLRDSNYPVDKIQKVLESHEPVESDQVLKFPEEMEGALDRAGIFSVDINDYSTVTIDLTHKHIEVHSERSDSSFRERLAWGDGEAPSELAPMTFVADGDMLKYALSRSREFRVKSSIINGVHLVRLVFDTGVFRHVAGMINPEEGK